MAHNLSQWSETDLNEKFVKKYHKITPALLQPGKDIPLVFNYLSLEVFNYLPIE